MSEFEILEDLIGRGVVSFATIGNSFLGDGKHRHVSISIRGTSRFTQGYGNTMAEALGEAITAIDKGERPREASQLPAQEENDPLADMLG